MRFTCDRDSLYKAIQSVSGVVASKGVHPVYESVLMTATSVDGAPCLELQATDLEVGMRVTIRDAEALSVDQPGTAVVPAQRLGSILRELAKGEVLFTWDGDRRESTIRAGRGLFKLHGPSPEDFPEIPDVGSSAEISIRAGELRRMIKRTAFAAARERMRFALNGLLLELDGSNLTLVATDGRRLAVETGTCADVNGDEPMRAIVPTKGMQQLDKSLSDPDELVHLAVGNNHFRGRTGSVSVTSRLVEGSFPGYREVVPADCSRHAVVDRGLFTSTLRRVALVTSREQQCVRMVFNSEGLTISARSSEGSAEETLACTYAGDEETLGFNPEFLIDALGVLDGEEVSFEWNGQQTPGKITEGNYTYVVMPLSLT